MTLQKFGVFLQNVFLPAVTAGIAVLVAWLNYSISQVDQDLKARIAEVDLSVKAAKGKRKGSHLNGLLPESLFSESRF